MRNSKFKMVSISQCAIHNSQCLTFALAVLPDRVKIASSSRDSAINQAHSVGSPTGANLHNSSQ